MLTKLKFLTAGESHGKALVGIIQGLPAGLEISKEYINNHLARRQLGYGRGARMKIESDSVKIISGVRHGKTIGSPISIMIENKDYQNWKDRMSTEPSNIEIKKITLQGLDMQTLLALINMILMILEMLLKDHLRERQQ